MSDRREEAEHERSAERQHVPAARPSKTSNAGVFKRAGRSFMADKAPQMAAAIAFFTIFSLGPILVIVISIAGLVWGEQAAEGAIVEQAEGAMDEDAAQMLQHVLAAASDTGQGTISLIVGIVTLIIGSTAVFVQLKDSLNTVFKVKPKSGRPFLSVLRDRGMAFLMVLLIAALLLASLAGSSVVSAMGSEIQQAINLPHVAIQAIELLVSALLITFLFALMFKYLPDINISWRKVMAGAALTAVLFVIGKFGLGLYLGRAGLAGAYGAAGGLILLLLWVYYSTMILLFGAEFTNAHASGETGRAEPSEHAEPV